MFDFGSKPDISADLPIYPSLDSTMKVNLVANESGQIWILHDKQFPCIVNWAEYDVDLGTLTLLSHDGKLVDLGMRVQPPLRKRMMKTKHLFTVLLGENDIQDFYILPLIVRQTDFSDDGRKLS